MRQSILITLWLKWLQHFYLLMSLHNFLLITIREDLFGGQQPVYNQWVWQIKAARNILHLFQRLQLYLILRSLTLIPQCPEIAFSVAIQQLVNAIRVSKLFILWMVVLLRLINGLVLQPKFLKIIIYLDPKIYVLER